MKTSLAHLPKRKRDELAYAVQMIRDETTKTAALFGVYACRAGARVTKKPIPTHRPAMVRMVPGAA